MSLQDKAKSPHTPSLRSQQGNFLPAGVILEAQLAARPSLIPIPKAKGSGKKAAGIRYEKLVQTFLSNKYGESYISSPWYKFRAAPGGDDWRFVQPDGLLFSKNSTRITLIEIKLKHTVHAWWQTKELYLPVIKHIYPETKYSFCICEIVQWLDPDIYFPEEILLSREIEDVTPGRFGVHILHSRDLKLSGRARNARKELARY